VRRVRLCLCCNSLQPSPFPQNDAFSISVFGFKKRRTHGGSTPSVGSLE
jgi:hypothetical protein